jgi:hypothetical protein
MKDFLTYLVSHLVSHPDQIEVTETTKEDVIQLHLKVAPTDMGQVIGKHGKVISSIRQLVKLKAHVQDQVATVTLEEVPPPANTEQTTSDDNPIEDEANPNPTNNTPNLS